MDFRRSLTADEMESWNSLLDQLEGVILAAGCDEVLWALDKTKVFTTKSLYNFVTDTRGANREMNCV